MTDLELLQDFEDMLNSFRSDINYYNTITKISESTEQRPRRAIFNVNKIFCFDEFSSLVANTLNIGHHKSVDGLYFIRKRNNIEFIFIEFKNILFNRADYDDFKKDMNCEFRIKALESVFSVFPHLIDLQFDNIKAKKLRSLFYKSKKRYYCVLNLYGVPNTSNAQSIINSDYLSVKRLSKYPFFEVELFSPPTFNAVINSTINTNNP